MDTFIIKGKPKQTVTLEVDGHSLTFTEGVEIAMFVVVAAQQSVVLEWCGCEGYTPTMENGKCSACGKNARR